MENKEVLLEIRNMHKAFGPIVALKDVDLTVNRGEIRCLIGENGSGKSTITSIAAGMQKATKGEMFYKGEPWHPESMVEAQQKGVSMILQEANTIPDCTVAENLFAGQEERFSHRGLFKTGQMNREANALLAKFGLNSIRAEDNINQYGFEDRKLIEIVRTVNDETELLVVDETTTALSMEGRQMLYKLMEELAKKGKAVVFISHDMDEIISRCSHLTVLRDGVIQGHIGPEELKLPETVRKIRHMMVGRDIGDVFYRVDYDASCQKEPALVLDHVTCGPIKDFSLTVHKGEIVGMGGLSGCGMHEIGRIAYGRDKVKKGRVLAGSEKITSVHQAVEKGIGYISKNRDQESVILEGSINTNVVMPSLAAMSKMSFISPGKEKKLAKEQVDLLSIKCEDGSQWVNTLSGGNKQKVSFAKWIAKGSDVVIMDCPTRGVDIGVKQAMYQLIYQMKQEGKAILMISEELPELIGMADRLVIMKDFQITGEFTRCEDLKEIDIIEYMI